VNTSCDVPEQKHASEEAMPNTGTLEPIFGAPGKAWCFQRVEIPHRKGGKPPHRESSLGLMEVTTWAKRRQSDGRAVT
jgi:hypothetical protein